MVYLDEMWGNKRHSKDKASVESDSITGSIVGAIHRPSGKGKFNEIDQ